MLIETKDINFQNLIFDSKSIISIDDYNNSILNSKVYLYGKKDGIVVEIPYGKMKEIFTESLNSDSGLYGGTSSNNKPEVNNIISVDENKFSVSISEHEWNGNINRSIEINANFKLKNDIIKTQIEYILGVEKYNQFSFSKYKANVEIGTLFDAEVIRKEIENKLIEYLSL